MDGAEAAGVKRQREPSCSTASLDDLIASKRTGRLQDAADIEMLLSLRRLLDQAP